MRFNTFTTFEGYFLTGRSEKGASISNCRTLCVGKFCDRLFSHRHTVDHKRHPPLAIVALLVKSGRGSRPN